MLRMFAALAIVAGLVFTISAEDKEKKEEIKGSVTCAKCDLGKSDKCATVVKAGDKVYWFDAAADKKHHKEVCKAAKEGTVTGTVKKDGDKMVITVSDVKFK